MIVATRRGDVELRGAVLNEWPARRGDSGAIAVTPRSLSSIPAAHQAIRIAAQSVAQLFFRVWRGEGFDRRRITGSWQARFFAGQPNQHDTWFTLWEQTEESLTARGNAYWLKAKDAQGRVAAIYVLPPYSVTPVWDNARSRKVFDVTVPGVGRYQVEDSVVLHFRGFGDPGALLAPSPVELFAHSIGATIAKIRHEARHYERGVQQKLGVVFPRGVSPEEAARWREAFDAENAGWENGSKTAVVGDGAAFTTLGLTLSDSQFIESMRFGIEEISRMFNVTASLLAAGDTKAGDKPLTPEHELTRWLRFGLQPRLRRLEDYVLADVDFFGPGARDYPQFDTDRFLRGDLATEADIQLKKVQSGQWLVDEARARDGLAPLPNGAGQIPQVVPVGGMANPNSAPAAGDTQT